MGTSFSNIQVWTEDVDAVTQSLQKMLQTPAYVSSAHGGWVSVFCDTSAQSEEKVTKQLSRRLPAAVFLITVYDSDIFLYTLYNGGKKTDEYDSSPNYFEKASKAREERVRGRAEIVLPFCVAGTTLADVEAVLHPASADDADKDPFTFAEDQAREFAVLLGMNERFACTRFSDVTNENLIEEYVDEEFRLVEPATLPQEYVDQKLRDAFTNRDFDEARMWILKGANINHWRGNTPLIVHEAHYCRPDIIAFFLEMGADPNVATRDSIYGSEKGVTSLMLAAAIHDERMPNERRLETLRLLLNAGADVNAVSEIGRTALKQAQGFVNPAHAERLSRLRLPFRPDQQAKIAEQSAAVVQLLREAGAKE